MWVARADVLFKVKIDWFTAVMWCVIFWQRVTRRNSLSNFAKKGYFCLPPLWLAHPHIEKLRVWPITHLFLRVSHCCSWNSKGQDLLGMWAVSPWLTSALVTIHQWELAYSQAYGFTRAAFSWMVDWLISSWHTRLLIINKRHADWKHHTRLAVCISSRHVPPNKHD